MDEEELTILEYAHFHRLTRPPSPTYIEVYRQISVINGAAEHPLPDDDRLLRQLAAGQPISERPALTEADRLYFASIISLYLDRSKTPDREVTRRERQLKIELPLLNSDHELDVISSEHRKSRMLVPRIPPLAHVSDSMDEGLGWPGWTHNAAATYKQGCKTEKLQITREAMTLLKLAVGNSDEQDIDVGRGLPYKRNTALEPLTPPLFPMAPPLSTTNHHSPITQLNLPASSSSHGAKEVADFEQYLFEDDAVGILDQDLFEDIWVQAVGNDHMLVHADDPPFPHRGHLDLKVEVPLTPLAARPGNGSDRFRSVGDPLFETLPPLMTDPDNVSDALRGDIWDEVLRPAAVQADRALENEQLSDLDVHGRVQVPMVDFSKREPLWQTESQESTQSRTAATMRPVIALGMHHWPGIHELERQLSWTPFPLCLGTVNRDETIEHDVSLESYIDPGPIDINDDNGLTWKLLGVRLLEEQEDDDEPLEVCPTVTHNQLDELLRKRKMEFDHYNATFESRRDARPSAVDALAMAPISSYAILSDEVYKRQSAKEAVNPGDSNTPYESILSPALDVDRFMHLQSGKPPPKRQCAAPTADSNNLNLEVSHTNDDNELEHAMTCNGNNLSFEYSIPQQNEMSVRSFIVSSALLSQRPLFQRITQLYPAANLIERQPVALPALTDDMASACDVCPEEATVAISPGVGVLCTTLAKVKQQPLPGHKNDLTLSDRVFAIARRYESLVVLVGVNVSLNSGDVLSERDCLALNQLTNAMVGKGVDVNVYCVPGGDEEMARWVVGMMTANDTPSSDIGLVEEETMWEQLLRQSGMNSFAAQAVLKGPPAQGPSKTEEPEARPHAAGLALFLQMTLQERLANFSNMLGGGNVLRRTSSILDADWKLI